MSRVRIVPDGAIFHSLIDGGYYKVVCGIAKKHSGYSDGSWGESDICERDLDDNESLIRVSKGRPTEDRVDTIGHNGEAGEHYQHDEVNNPKHYDLFPDGQSIDIIRSSLTDEEWRGFLKGNVLKYRLRAGEKGPADKCLAKANWYRDKLWGEQ